MKRCKYCNRVLEYVSTPTRGYWAAIDGKQCDAASAKFNSKQNHMPVWNTASKTWEIFD